ncbi:hypothetical protein NE557_08225, partial [Bifidobacterium animalis]|nr:hypothetical protein [Bifidobacterium animalis]
GIVPMVFGLHHNRGRLRWHLVRAFHWNDSDWMAKRAKTDPHQGPVAIYEVNANSWRDDVHSYRELSDKLVPYVAKLGFTHVEFMPFEEYPYLG